MNNLTIIDERVVLGKEFRIYGDFENPLFLAKDVAEWIDYCKDNKGFYDVAKMLSTIDDDEKTKIFSTLTTRNNLPSPVKSTVAASTRWFLTEEGLYEVLMQSRKPIAKAFKKEVKEILKTIRKHGAYMTPEILKKVILTPEFMLELVTTLMDEQAKNKNLEQKIEADKPKVDLANAVSATEDTILVASFAKILNQNGINIGQNRLYAWLRENGYLGVKGDYYNLPTQKSLNKQLFITKESEWYDKGGNPHIKLTAMVTGKGQLYFIGKFKEQFKAA